MLLERGREYLPGSFPTGLSDIAGHVRFTVPGGEPARGPLEGLFDMRLGADVSVLTASGLGGGSLINAGVMEFPKGEVFAQPAWPSGLPNATRLARRAKALRRELGVSAVNALTFGAPLPRVTAMEAAASGISPARPTPITVALADGEVSAGQVQLSRCIGCGNCATGCNHAAKVSLDVNLLRRAVANGVELFTGATVHRLRRVEDAGTPHWCLEVWHTDRALRRRMQGPLELRAAKVILAAGTLGSTEILLRSGPGGLALSPMVGRRFSANGDVIGAAFDSGAFDLNGVAAEPGMPAPRHAVGPTITTMVDRRDEHDAPLVMQDLAIPAALRRLFEEATATASLLHRLPVADTDEHASPDRSADPCAVDPAKVGRSMGVALIVHDSAEGVMTPADAHPSESPAARWHGAGLKPEALHRYRHARPVDPKDLDTPTDAGLRIDWRGARDDPRLLAAHAWFAETACKRWRAQGLPNPAWRPLPEAMKSLLDVDHGPLMTVHPLGGCAMADDRRLGVVNTLGQVFDASRDDPRAVHETLVVLDGSIIPTSLGINPALTIATLADWAVRRLRHQWGLPRPRRRAPRCMPQPRYRDVPPPGEGNRPLDTRVQIVERLTGPIEWGGRSCWAELSLVYEDTTLLPRDAAPTLDGRVLHVRPDPELSRLRVFDSEDDPFEPVKTDAEALMVAPVLNGTLRVFHRERSGFVGRSLRTLPAWLVNRGARDGWQGWLDRRSGHREAGSGLLSLAWDAAKLSTRAGEVRLLEYELELDVARAQVSPQMGHLRWQALASARVSGHKRITYARRSNPWQQLMQVELTALAGLPLGRSRTLEVDPVYFVRQGIPLMRIVDAQDEPTAMADVAGFLLYVARLLISIHLWTFRKPDRASMRVPQRLPGPIADLPPPQVHELAIDDANGGRIRLTRYPRPDGTPVLLIHGYAANGTVFTHHTLKPSLAEFLHREGFEPWVLDLRSSSGLRTGTFPWRFEDIARGDVPRAIEYVAAHAADGKIDVVAHCGGAAMLAMAMMDGIKRTHQIETQIRRCVMSQLGPAMRFSPANTLRGYVLTYLTQLLGEFSYDLRPQADDRSADASLIDRFLASMPYRDDPGDSTFDLENPPLFSFARRTPWVGTRHRLDALVGVMFDARRMSQETLAHIDDFFGPISYRTAAQPLHFSRLGFLSDADGVGAWGMHRLNRLSGIPLLTLHSQDNDLVSPRTEQDMRWLSELYGLDWRPWRIPHRGHYDALIGADNRATFKRIGDFLKHGR